MHHCIVHFSLIKNSFVFTVYFYVSSVLSSLLVMEVLIQSQDMTLSCLKNLIMAQVCLLLINYGNAD